MNLRDSLQYSYYITNHKKSPLKTKYKLTEEGFVAEPQKGPSWVGWVLPGFGTSVAAARKSGIWICILHPSATSVSRISIVNVSLK